jgi:tripartite-type tricarboxylate transporter receptor subunit TctC
MDGWDTRTACRFGAKLLTAVIVLIAALTDADCAFAQPTVYPTRTSTIIVPFVPGGVTDFLARAVAENLGEQFGKSFIIENKGGAGMIVGALAASKAPPDGYTMLMATNGTLAINPTLYKSLPYAPLKDLMPVALVGSLPFVLLVNPDLPIHNIGDLIRLAKEQPGQLNIASGGVGSSAHVFGELLQSVAGIKLVHVAYRGNSPAMTDVIAGHVQMMFSDIGSAEEFIKSGKVRALAVTTHDRFPGAPDIPTIAESGVPGYSAESWQMLVAPAGVPDATVFKLNSAVNAAVASPAMQQKLIQLQVTPKGTGTPTELQAFMHTEIDRWAAVLHDAGIAGSQ